MQRQIWIIRNVKKDSDDTFNIESIGEFNQSRLNEIQGLDELGTHCCRLDPFSAAKLYSSHSSCYPEFFREEDLGSSLMFVRDNSELFKQVRNYLKIRIWIG